MLHKMSEVRGWSHNEMMEMSKSIFFRYYGYWYADQLNDERYREYQEHKQQLEQKSQQNREALGIRN
jgi:hypothetical protein